MKTTDTFILKAFQTVLNRKHLTEEAYNELLKKWDLVGIDLDAEMQKINEKKSNLTKSRRDAVPEFIKLREILDKQKEDEASAISFGNDSQTSLYQDTLIQ